MRRLVVWAFGVLVACGGSDAQTPAKVDAGTDPDAVQDHGPSEVASTDTALDVAAAATVTYWSHVRPILEQRCNTCHRKGDIGTWPLDSYDDAKKHIGKALSAIAAGRMPPWMPDAACRTYQFERHILPNEISVLQQWQASGAAEGDKAAAAPVPLPETPTLPAPDLDLSSPLPYTATTAVSDDYRCFALGSPQPEERWVRATQVVPDDKQTVHHVLVFLIEPHLAAQVDQLDQLAQGPGWTCYGGPGVSPPHTIAGWAPGAVPAFTRPDTAIRLPKGSRLVMQVHYNTAAATPKPDRTRFQAWFHTTQPKQLVDVKTLPHLGIAIKAGDSASKHEKLFKNTSTKPWTVVGVIGHMHTLGTRIRITHLPAQGKEACLLDIPHWDFHWQQGYALKVGEELTVQPGDSVKLACTYDNSAANQPRRQQGAPKDVYWGEGTFDEMCLAYLSTVVPYAPYQGPTKAVCNGFQGCYDACLPKLNMTGCTMQCGVQAGGGCANCTITGLVGCAASGCGVQSQALVDCLSECQFAKDCIAQSCLGAIVQFDACAKPKVDAGECAAPLDACGAKLTPAGK